MTRRENGSTNDPTLTRRATCWCDSRLRHKLAACKTLASLQHGEHLLLRDAADNLVASLALDKPKRESHDEI